MYLLWELEGHSWQARDDQQKVKTVLIARYRFYVHSLLFVMRLAYQPRSQETLSGLAGHVRTTELRAPVLP